MYIRYFKHIASLCCFVFLSLTIIMPAQSAPRTIPEAPPADTSSMPDSITRLIQNIFSLIDSLEIKDSTRIDIHVDTTRLVKDTIFITTEFVEDSIMAQELLQQLDSIVGKKVVADIPIQKTDSVLAKPYAKDTLRKIPPKPQPLKMCAQAQAILQEAKNKFTIIPTHEIPVNPIFMPIIFNGQRPRDTPALYENIPEKKYVPYTIYRRKNSIDKAKSLAELGAYAQATAIIAHPEKVRYTPERLPKAIHPVSYTHLTLPTKA